MVRTTRQPPMALLHPWSVFRRCDVTPETHIKPLRALHPSPVYLLAGGGGWRTRKTSDPLLQRIFSETCTKPPVVAYIGAASGDNQDFFRWLSSLFKTAGAREVQLAPTATPKADMVATRRILKAADLVFISGGDVEEGMRALADRDLVSFLRQLHATGKPFFGLSAGSIMLARAWVRWRDPDDDATAEVFDCLGLAPMLCDTHAEEDDWEELHALLRLSPSGTVGYGIPSGGGLVVAPDGTVKVLGTSGPRLRKTAAGVRRLADA